MSKLKVLIVLIVIIGGVVYGVNSINQNLDLVQGVDTKLDDGVTADGVTWYQSTDKSFNIAVFEQPLFIDYTAENAQSLAEQSGLNKLVLAVNGGFFRGSYVDSEYAGLLQIKGEKLFPLVEFDDQLTHILVYDVQDDILAVEPAEGFDPENYGENYTLMQTGPLVIKDGQVQTDLIAGSLNGTGRYLRTLIGFADDGTKFVVVSKINFDLTKMANALLEFAPFQGKSITVINLDGGTSTAMYSRDFDQYNFGTSKRLPSIIGVQDAQLVQTDQTQPASSAETQAEQ